MATYVPPKINTEFIFYITLVSQANTMLLQTNPTIAAGDFKVSTDGGAFGNPATLPAVTPASGKAVKVTLSTSEMNGGNVLLVASDAAGAEWCDASWNIQTSARQVDDLAFPVVSGRGLDVTATGAAGIDWGNVENPTTAVNLSATNIDPDQAAATYGDGAVWIDTVNGAAGTTAYVNGTQHNPCSTLASALTIATAVKLRRFRLVGASSITLASGYTGWTFEGDGSAAIALGGQALASVSITGCIVSGTATTGPLFFSECSIFAVTVPPNSVIEHCTLAGTITMGAAGDYYVFDSEAANIGGTPITIDFGAGLGDSTFQARKWTGTLSLANMGQAGTDSAAIAGEGRLEIAASSQNSTVRLAGHLTLANSGTNMTIVEGPNYRSDDNTAAILNVPTAIENADGILDRNMATGTDSGSATVRTPRQALRFLRNKWSISGTTLTVTKEDDSTTSWTSTLATTPGADPVTESDPAGP